MFLCEEDNEFCGPFNFSSVTHIVIGPEVNAIDDKIFYVSYYFDSWGCDGNMIDTVTCYALMPPTITEACFYCDTYSNAVLEVPEGSLEAYRNAPGWKEFQNIIVIDDEVTTGDVNGDGNVMIDDVTALIDILLNSDTSDNEAADCNGDGNVTIDDVTALIDYLLNDSW